jgi:hypothetical protein
MTADLSARHPSVQQVARWLTPNPNLPPGPPSEVAAMFADMRDALLGKLGDGPELVVGLRHLLDAKDATVRQAIADGTP